MLSREGTRTAITPHTHTHAAASTLTLLLNVCQCVENEDEAVLILFSLYGAVQRSVSSTFQPLIQGRVHCVLCVVSWRRRCLYLLVVIMVLGRPLREHCWHSIIRCLRLAEASPTTPSPAPPRPAPTRCIQWERRLADVLYLPVHPLHSAPRDAHSLVSRKG